MFPIAKDYIPGKRFSFEGYIMAKVKVKKMKGMKLAYIEHVGAYSTIPFDELIGELYGWAKQNKAKPGFKPLTRYPDDPNKVPQENLRSQVAIPIRGDVKPSGRVQIMEISEGEVAVLKHEAPAAEYSNSYSELARWIEDNGYEPSCAPFEIYYKKPKIKEGQAIIFAEINFPVKSKT